MRHPGKYAEEQDSEKREIGSKIAGMRKEKYFTQDTIQEKSQGLLDNVATTRRRHADIIFRPEKAALLVLDMQEYFLQEDSHAFVPSAPAIIPGVSGLIAAFSNADYPIVVTRHLNTPEDAGMMAKWWRDLINPQDAYSHNVAVNKPSKLISINKTQYDAFYHTSLENDLHEHWDGTSSHLWRDDPPVLRNHSALGFYARI